ncbi:MAG: MoaD/ThiS family protein [Candidatus Hydrogenedentota bacterium]
MKKSISIEYYAILREQRGLSSENVESAAETAEALFAELSAQHQFTIMPESLKVVVNEEFVEWSHPFKDGDTVVFIPPVAGG